MSDISSLLGAKMAVVQQNAAMSMIKKSAQADAQIADILSTAAQTAPAGSRGRLVDLSA